MTGNEKYSFMDQKIVCKIYVAVQFDMQNSFKRIFKTASGPEGSRPTF